MERLFLRPPLSVKCTEKLMRIDKTQWNRAYKHALIAAVSIALLAVPWLSNPAD